MTLTDHAGGKPVTPRQELAVRAAIAAVLAVAIGLLDEPLLGINIHPVLCGVIGAALAIGVSIFIFVIDD